MRLPKGSDPEGKHTGTGGIERHVALTKLTLLKLKEELESQNVFMDKEDLGNEAAMAQNLTLEYGGVTPAMAAMGCHPRGFFEFEDATLTSVMGAGETSMDIFENIFIRYMRLLRQTRKCQLYNG